MQEAPALRQRLGELSKEELQRALGVKPQERSSRFKGVARRKGMWAAKVRRAWEGEGWSPADSTHANTS